LAAAIAIAATARAVWARIVSFMAGAVSCVGWSNDPALLRDAW